MAIVKMKKFTLFAFEAERKRLLEELQRFGYVNFSKSDSIEQFDYLKDVEVSTLDNNYIEESTRIKWMIDYVGRFVEKEKGLSALKKGPVVYTFSELEKEASSYDYIPDFNILSEISKKVDSNNQRLTAIDNTIKELSPWIHVLLTSCDSEAATWTLSVVVTSGSTIMTEPTRRNLPSSPSPMPWPTRRQGSWRCSSSTTRSGVSRRRSKRLTVAGRRSCVTSTTFRS